MQYTMEYSNFYINLYFQYKYKMQIHKCDSQ